MATPTPQIFAQLAEVYRAEAEAIFYADPPAVEEQLAEFRRLDALSTKVWDLAEERGYSGGWPF